MDGELKIPKSYSLDPVVVAWISKKAGENKITGREENSDSSVANSILRAAMQKEATEDEIAHLQKFVRKQILKQK